MSKQVYLDLVDGFHIKVTPLYWDTWVLVDTSQLVVAVLVEETKCGFQKGEVLLRRDPDLFCIAGYSQFGRIKAVAPDLSGLGAKK